MSNQSSNQRNYGIDLLRILSMFFVLLLHCLGHGGILEDAPVGTPVYHVAWLLETVGYCAVNCYALISGYVGLNSRFRLSNLIGLWFQVVFYTVCFAFVEMRYLDTGFVWDTLSKALHPVSNNAYWYFTAYCGMFFFLPLLNSAVKNMPKQQLQWALAGLLILFSLYTTQQDTDVFFIINGYHALWLMILYLLGAYIKKYNVLESVRLFVWPLVYLGAVLVSWGVKLLNEQFLDPAYSEQCINLIQFTSPTILVCAVSLLMFCARLPITGLVQKGIAFVAPLTFSVYLIHENPFVRQTWITGQFADLAFYPVHRMLLKLGFVCVVLFAACITIDYIRSLLFKWLHLKKLAELPEKLLDRRGRTHV